MSRLAPLALFLFSAAAHAQTELTVKVVEIKGSADWRAAVDREWSALKAGDVLKKGSWVQTGLKSRVHIKFGDNTVVQLKSATLIQIDEALKADDKTTGRVKLALGNVHVEVERKTEVVDFKVVTPQVTTSVKGTGYDVNHFSDRGSYITVAHGVVRTDNGAIGRDMAASSRADSRLLPADVAAQLERAVPMAFDASFFDDVMGLGDPFVYLEPSVGAIKVESAETGTTSTTTNGGTTTTDTSLPPVPIDGGATLTTIP